MKDQEAAEQRLSEDEIEEDFDLESLVQSSDFYSRLFGTMGSHTLDPKAGA